jgi:hypothetical protein
MPKGEVLVNEELLSQASMNIVNTNNSLRKVDESLKTLQEREAFLEKL